MAERERERIRERGPREESPYEQLFESRETFQERQRTGKVVIRREEREFEINRQALNLWFLNPLAYKDTCLNDWLLFLNDIRTHSGRHRHQGGLAIFVLEGKGYTVVDGVRCDWEAGDLVLLPVKENGVEHQHFNSEPGKPCMWLAFINLPIWEWGASEMAQTELSPEWMAQQQNL